MKVLMLGNFALYFMPRLVAFNQKLKSQGDELLVIQEADKNKLYGNMPQLDPTEVTILHFQEISDSAKPYKQRIIHVLDKFNPDVLITGFVAFPYGAIG